MSGSRPELLRAPAKTGSRRPPLRVVIEWIPAPPDFPQRFAAFMERQEQRQRALMAPRSNPELPEINPS